MSNAVYCAFSSEEPDARVFLCMKECGATKLLVDSTTSHRFKSGFNISECLKKAHGYETMYEPTILRFDEIANDHSLATIIFTSGSTGIPKAVPHNHRTYISCFPLFVKDGIMNCQDVILQRAPVTFVIHHQDVFGSFYFGACLALMRPGSHRDANHIVETIHTQCISAVTITPTLLLALVDDETDFDKIQSLRVALCVG